MTIRRRTLLIVGCGDVGMRVLRELRGRWRVLALTSSPNRHEALRAAGALPLAGNLDRPATLARLAGLADAVLVLAPPPSSGDTDARSRNLVHALARQTRVQRVVYASTSGVYGDCQGQLIDETRRIDPRTPRARRRADAEAQWRAYGRRCGVCVTLLRVPGIYALDRVGGDPRERLRRGSPTLQREHDVFTNHIHADDLARACIAALERGASQRVVHTCDDTEMTMGDYFDWVADRFDLPRPVRLSRPDAQARLNPIQLSFMSESRRLDNRRLKRELRLRLRHPTIQDGLRPDRS